MFVSLYLLKTKEGKILFSPSIILSFIKTKLRKLLPPVRQQMWRCR